MANLKLSIEDGTTILDMDDDAVNTSVVDKKPRQSNTDFIAELMEFPEVGGAMSQAFILESIRFYCKVVLENERPETTTSNMPMFNPQLWWDIAFNINIKITDRYLTANKEALNGN